MRVIDYFSKNSVLFLNNNDKKEILTKMVSEAESKGLISDKKEFEDALFERESIMSTDVGWQVAIPHAKLKTISKFFVIPAVLKNDTDWKAGNNQSVKLVFLIGGPANDQKQYLQILSKVSLVVRNPERRKALLAATSAEEVLAQFSDL
ncbi:MAG: PTS sugar transporter subunit IIA [Sphaerochaetaceae bacterium]|jgi:PTS system nitrogen regulatory IIA component|nr:PTS sugar transporter subunit IIA [Sphaerochaetaceae bacterium]MDC7237826.1 PTS sugar transporter subunit IIA [Sphaerochaetaceae bacterium]MDC7242561.1 PTS sugar transporter subunit IIA [Sphaerochaetaceae bacterium]